MNDNELYHSGVKGMKWGVRKRRESSGPRTNWGKNRAYAKEQDAINKARWKETKQQVKSGKLSKDSAKYKSEKHRNKIYNHTRTTYRNMLLMTKASRGKQMKKLGITADKPYSTIKMSKAASSEAKNIVKQGAKNTVGLLVGTPALLIGSTYVMNRIVAKRNSSNSNMIDLKPWQYKVK